MGTNQKYFQKEEHKLKNRHKFTVVVYTNQKLYLIVEHKFKNMQLLWEAPMGKKLDISTQI